MLVTFSLQLEIKNRPKTSQNSIISWSCDFRKYLNLLWNIVQVNLFQKLAKFIWMSKQNKNNNLCTQHVLQVFINNEQFFVMMWVSWSKIRASDKDLPVPNSYKNYLKNAYVIQTCTRLGVIFIILTCFHLTNCFG